MVHRCLSNLQLITCGLNLGPNSTKIAQYHHVVRGVLVGLCSPTADLSTNPCFLLVIRRVMAIIYGICFDHLRLPLAQLYIGAAPITELFLPFLLHI